MTERYFYRGKELHSPQYRLVTQSVDELPWDGPIDTTNLHHLSVHLYCTNLSGLADIVFKMEGGNGAEGVGGTAILLPPDKHIGPGTLTGATLSVPNGSSQIYLVYKDLPKWVRPVLAWGEGWNEMTGGMVMSLHGWMV